MAVIHCRLSWKYIGHLYNDWWSDQGWLKKSPLVNITERHSSGDKTGSCPLYHVQVRILQILESHSLCHTFGSSRNERIHNCCQKTICMDADMYFSAQLKYYCSAWRHCYWVQLCQFEFWPCHNWKHQQGPRPPVSKGHVPLKCVMTMSSTTFCPCSTSSVTCLCDQ